MAHQLPCPVGPGLHERRLVHVLYEFSPREAQHEAQLAQALQPHRVVATQAPDLEVARMLTHSVQVQVLLVQQPTRGVVRHFGLPVYAKLVFQRDRLAHIDHKQAAIAAEQLHLGCVMKGEIRNGIKPCLKLSQAQATSCMCSVRVH